MIVLAVLLSAAVQLLDLLTLVSLVAGFWWPRLPWLGLAAVICGGLRFAVSMLMRPGPAFSALDGIGVAGAFIAGVAGVLLGAALVRLLERRQAKG